MLICKRSSTKIKNQKKMDPQQDQPQDQSNDQQSLAPKQQAVDRIKQANNVLVTVKSDPSVDELAAVIGFTLMLNKLGKHATAVFSGQVPSTLEFLKPEETLETNTDSLRDFIVSLDKSKADKLRYKVEENVVRIYITPYKTSLSEEDLEFTQGDFNVDVVVALGVTQREELDQAITAHGRILHDATVVTVTAGQDVSQLGQINWQEPGASSLSEMLVSISEAFQGGLIDEQIATAFLTGIVSETERFSNNKTSPKVMTMSAQLMAAGANQQLIANELEKAVELNINDTDSAPAAVPKLPEDEQKESTASSDGTLSIAHSSDDEKAEDNLDTENSTEGELPEVKSAEETNQSEQEPLLPPSEQQNNRLLDSDQPSDNPPGSDNQFQDLLGGDQQPALSDGTSVELQPHAAPADEKPPLPDRDADQIHIDVEGNLIRKNAANPKHKVIQPLEPKPEEKEEPQATLGNGVLPPPPELDTTPSPPLQDNTTLEQIEESVKSPHLGADASGAAASNPPEAPLEPTSFDAYRLPNSTAGQASPPIADVSGNFIDTTGTSATQDGQNEQDSQLPPPPVPPPFSPQP